MHSGWTSTRDFASTGETFYFGSFSIPDSKDEDLDDLAPIGDAKAWKEALPPSQQWLAEAEGCKIPTSRVSTEEEKQLYKENFPKIFNGQQNGSANSYDAIDFDAFTVWWNRQVDGP